jgi:hypothetical protein
MASPRHEADDGRMTTATMAPSTATPTTAERRLRLVLTANAATSALAGVVALAAGDWAAERLGVDTVGLVRAVGAALLVFAAGVLAVARARRDVLHREAALVSAADAAWVVATVVLVVAGAFSTEGAIIAAVMAAGVADFGALQLWFRGRMSIPSTR